MEVSVASSRGVSGGSEIGGGVVVVAAAAGWDVEERVVLGRDEATIRE